MQCQSVYQREVWCVSGCWGLQDLISRSRCVSSILVSVLSGHVKKGGVSQYLPQGDDVGMSEGVSILVVQQVMRWICVDSTSVNVQTGV